MKRLALVLLLAGCAGQAYDYRDALGAGYAAVDALATTTAELCGAPLYEGGDCVGSISTETRDQARDLLRQAVDLLDEARTYQVDGSTDIAQQRIAQARSVLALVAKLVESKA